MQKFRDFQIGRSAFRAVRSPRFWRYRIGDRLRNFRRPRFRFPAVVRSLSALTVPSTQLGARERTPLFPRAEW